MENVQQNAINKKQNSHEQPKNDKSSTLTRQLFNGNYNNINTYRFPHKLRGKQLENAF